MEHPITPPPELVDNWLAHAPNPLDRLQHVATQAARWGADQELEACVEWLNFYAAGAEAADLRAARRPKPSSLKQQALDALGPEPLPEPSLLGDAILNCGAIESHRIIRRALESLPDPQD